MGASFETGNMGVSALAASLVKIIVQMRSYSQISFFIGEKIAKRLKIRLAEGIVGIDIVNYRMSPKACFKEHLLGIFLMAFVHKIMPTWLGRKRIADSCPSLKMLVEADFVGDIRGGDSFSDIYGFRGFLLGSLPSVIALLMGKELILLPQTYGPYKSFLSRRVARFILSRCSFILSRDMEGIRVATELLGREAKKKRIFFCPDVAFLLDSLKPDTMEIQPPIVKGPDVPMIGLNVSGLLYNGGFTRDNMFGLKLDYRAFVHGLSERLLKETNAHLLLVPHTFAPKGHVESDNEACAEVWKLLSPAFEGRVHLVSREYDQSAIKGIIGLCDFFIGSRMHACIASLSQGIPTVGVAYSRKFVGVFSSINCGDAVIDARAVNLDEAVRKIGGLFQKRGELAQVIAERVNEARGRVMDIFEGLLLQAEAGSVDLKTG